MAILICTVFKLLCFFYIALTGGLSGPQVFGIVFGVVCIVIIVITCAVIACYKKRHVHSSSTLSRTPTATFISRSQSSRIVSPNRPSNYAPTLATPVSSTDFQNGVRTTTQPIEEPTHSEATTHAGEAPPAYHTAEQYRTMTVESYKNYTLSNMDDSTHNDPLPSSPPAYIDTSAEA